MVQGSLAPALLNTVNTNKMVLRIQPAVQNSNFLYSIENKWLC